MNFDKLKQEDAVAKVALVTPPFMAMNELFYAGDHLQKGTGWIGPGPQLGASDYQTFIDTLSPAFISQNAIGRVTKRKVNATCNKNVRWGMVLERDLGPKEKATPAEDALMAEADALLMTWWKDRNILRILQVFQTRYELCGRAGLRFFIPTGKLVNGEVPKEDLGATMARIYLECPDVINFHVYTDTDSMDMVGIYLYTEIVTADDGSTTQTAKAELTYLLDADTSGERLTALEVIDADSRKVATPLDLGGRLWHFEAFGESLISEQIRSQQRLLNLAKTVERRNLADNGWLEEFLINAQLPGHYEGEEPNRKFIPDPIRRGPGVTRDIKGLESGDSSAPTVASPSVTWRPIVDPDSSISVADDAERAIHKEAAQLHALDEGGGNVSGETLKQRRADFETSLESSGEVLASAGKWALETLLKLAAVYAGTPDKFDGLRASFEPRFNTGPRTAEELNEISSRVEKGLLSRETGMALQGVDDVDAEEARIKAEDQLRLYGEKFNPNLDSADGVTPTDGAPVTLDADGNPVAAGVASTQALNGAQYDGLLKTLGLFSAKILAEGTALQGLVALGISQETAQAMIDEQKSVSLTPEQLASAGL